MKKYIAGMVVAAAAIVASAGPSWAFQSVQITTITAQATTGGARSAAFTLAIRNTNTPFGANQTQVNWTGVDPLSTAWKLADQLLVINSTVTDNGGGIKIYTDNTAADANPRFVPPVPGTPILPVNVAAGLVKGGAATSSETPLPMAWTIKTSTRIVEGGNENTGVGAADPQNGPTTGFNNQFQWLNMTDKYNWANGTDFNGDGDTNDAGDSAPLALDAPFVTMINKTGIHFGKADTEFGAHPDGANSFVYLEANFAGADVQQLYKTTTLRVEAYIQ